MPDIYRYFGFVFFFHSNEHDPIHVHVQHDHHESIFEILMQNGKVSEVRVRDKKEYHHFRPKTKSWQKNL